MLRTLGTGSCWVYLFFGLTVRYSEADFAVLLCGTFYTLMIQYIFIYNRPFKILKIVWPISHKPTSHFP